MARASQTGTPWEKYVIALVFVGLGIVVLALIIGPQGSQKEALNKIKPKGKRKIEKKELYIEAQKKLIAAKPKDKAWSELQTEDLDAMVDKVTVEGLTKKDLRSRLNDIWRLKRTEEQTLPSDDPKERWKQLTGNKFETIRKIWLKDESGFLNSPQVDVYQDEGRTTKAGTMNHDEWVDIIEEKGSMTHVRRRRDKKEVWIETKYLQQIYTKDQIEKGPGG